MCNSNSKDFKPKRSTRRPIKSYYSTLIMNSLETKMKSRIALIKVKDYWLKSCFIYCLSRFISGPSIPVCWINFTIFSIDIELATSSEHLMINLVNSVVGFFFLIEACSSSKSQLNSNYTSSFPPFEYKSNLFFDRISCFFYFRRLTANCSLFKSQSSCQTIS